MATQRRGPAPDGLELTVHAPVIEWRGPAPFYFARIPAAVADDIAEVAAMAPNGWGVIPVDARIGSVSFSTSLFPRDGGYLLPLKNAVRKPAGISTGDEIAVEMRVRLGDQRP